MEKLQREQEIALQEAQRVVHEEHTSCEGSMDDIMHKKTHHDANHSPNAPSSPGDPRSPNSARSKHSDESERSKESTVHAKTPVMSTLSSQKIKSGNNKSMSSAERMKKEIEK